MAVNKRVPGDYHSFSNRDLRRERLLLDVALLRKQLTGEKPPRKKFLERVRNYLEHSLGQIMAIAMLAAAVISPIWSYVSSQRQEKLVRINGDVLSILLSKAPITNIDLMNISIHDPQVVAPILFDQLNKDSIRCRHAEIIYKRMYEVNKDISRHSMWDKILFSIVTDNQDILKNELCLNARRQFEKPYTAGQASIAETYINLIFAFDLEREEDFREVLDVLTLKCDKDDGYKDLCKYRDEKVELKKNRK